MQDSLIHDVILDLVTQVDNSFMTETTTNAKIGAAIFGSNVDAAPGLDGFDCSFFSNFLGHH